MPNFIGQALKGEDVTVYGDGTQTRSLCYVSDLVEGVIRLMLSAANEPINIGNPQELTIAQIARTILRLTGSRCRIVFRPLPVDDPKVRRPDISLARRVLGWEPAVTPDEGLRRTLPYFEAELGRSKA